MVKVKSEKKNHHTNSQTPACRAPRRIWQHSLLDFEYLWTPRPTTSCLGREKVAKFRGEVFRSETDETAWHSVCTMWALCRTDLPQSRTKSLAHDLNESTDPDVFFRIPTWAARWMYINVAEGLYIDGCPIAGAPRLQWSSEKSQSAVRPQLNASLGRQENSKRTTWKISKRLTWEIAGEKFLDERDKRKLQLGRQNSAWKENWTNDKTCLQIRELSVNLLAI